MTDPALERLRDEVDMLRERVRQLEAVLVPDGMQIPIEWKLTASEARVFSHIASRDMATKDSILLAMYSDRNDLPPEPKIVDVFVCKIRSKLKPFGVVIETVWGQGYRLLDRSRFCERAAA
ncbi:helix-turn-helix domain-containing protein [Mycoplana ramosa]|uniref:Helix-turn-helix domain-containing protein n=1 Tax=Mycoplana ramosa TaxID=40837 RepID=A0ABW3YWG0_MYCRA